MVEDRNLVFLFQYLEFLFSSFRFMMLRHINVKLLKKKFQTLGQKRPSPDPLPYQFRVQSPDLLWTNLICSLSLMSKVAYAIFLNVNKQLETILFILD